MKRQALHDHESSPTERRSGSDGSWTLRSAWVVLLLALSLLVPGQAAHAAAAMSVQVVESGFIDNDGNGVVSLGDQINFVTTATNTGTVPLTNVSVSDTFSAGGTCSNASMSVNGGQCIINSSHIVSAADVTAGQVVDTGTATSTQTGTITQSATIPIGFGTFTASAVLTSNADGDHSGTVTPGDVLTYTFTMTNINIAGMTNVVVATTGSAMAFSPNTHTCPTVAIGATCVLTSTYTVTAADAAAGSINASAQVS